MADLESIARDITEIKVLTAGTDAKLTALDAKLEAHMARDEAAFAAAASSRKNIYERVSSLENTRSRMQGFAKVSVLVTIVGAFAGILARIKGIF